MSVSLVSWSIAGSTRIAVARFAWSALLSDVDHRLLRLSSELFDAS